MKKLEDVNVNAPESLEPTTPKKNVKGYAKKPAADAATEPGTETTEPGTETTEPGAAAAAAAATAKRAKKVKQREELKTAKKLLNDFTKTAVFNDLPTDVKDALTLLAPDPRSTAFGPASPVADMFDKLFGKVGDSIGELALFKETKWGPSEMRKRVRNALKKAKPENRKWITFNPETEVWTLVGIGPEAPANWK